MQIHENQYTCIHKICEIREIRGSKKISKNQNALFLHEFSADNLFFSVANCVSVDAWR